jgi:predicted enzyme related to lactoylglutathione lyase
MAEPSNPVNWFEIPVNDLPRAMDFYEHVLGVPLAANDMGAIAMAWFPMASGASGAAGTLIKGDGYAPSADGTLVYFAVADIEAALARVEERGGRTLMPKTSIGQHGFIAHFEDTEGNRVALHART